MNEKTKIGANSATDIIETAKASPFVISMTNNSTAKLRIQMPTCMNNPAIMMACTNRFRNRLNTDSFFLSVGAEFMFISSHSILNVDVSTLEFL